MPPSQGMPGLRPMLTFWERFMIGFPRRSVLAAIALAAGVLPASAQSDAAAGFPARPIRVIVRFAAGGGNDLFARVVGQRLSELLGQSVVIENRPAAGGRQAAE